MSERESQYDYPVELANNHKATDPPNHATSDKFHCLGVKAYTYTASWPAWDFCPFCGDEL